MSFRASHRTTPGNPLQKGRLRKNHLIHLLFLVLVLGCVSLAKQALFANWLVPSSDSTIYTMTVCTRLPDDSDTTNDCMQKQIFAYNPVGIKESTRIEDKGLTFKLLQNEPNPFHSRTVISYSLPAACAVTLKVYDITGRLVETLVDEEQNAGVHRIDWSPKQAPGGIYFYCLEADDFSSVKKTVLLR